MEDETLKPFAYNMAGRAVAAWHLGLQTSAGLDIYRPEMTIADPSVAALAAEENGEAFSGEDYFRDAACIAEIAGEEAEAVFCGSPSANVPTSYRDIVQELSERDEPAAQDLLDIQRGAAREIVALSPTLIEQIAAALLTRGKISQVEMAAFMESQGLHS